MTQAVLELRGTVGTASACAALAVPRASFYRHILVPQPAAATARPTPKRALSMDERTNVVQVLNSERFMDLAPRQVYAALLDDGKYLCSPRTMYRLLASAQQVRERRDQRRHPTYVRPELVANAPNQVWSWDITKLLGPEKWTYFYLYVMLDIFSRYVVAYMVATREASVLAQKLIEAGCASQGIQAGQLTIHADRGAAMTSKPVALLMADLGITKSHSRPHVSDDNPYSEAQFKTIKYRPGFPDRFGSIQHARAICGEVFDWYNNVHYHTGLGLLTPASVHRGEADAVRGRRDQVLSRAYAANPERFVLKPPSAPGLAPAVWINPPRPIEIVGHGLQGPPDSRSSILGQRGPSPVGQSSLKGTPSIHELVSALQ